MTNYDDPQLNDLLNVDPEHPHIHVVDMPYRIKIPFGKIMIVKLGCGEGQPLSLGQSFSQHGGILISLFIQRCVVRK
ncbi:MAG: hypothetical protein IPH82_30125 [Chloroflexi bacterium]|nr:hypothetical protein [Chloroflexota bacterium]